MQAPIRTRCGESGATSSNCPEGLIPRSPLHVSPSLSAHPATCLLCSMTEGPLPSSSTPAPLPAAEADEPELTDAECWWRDHQNWLAERGYMLRPRYRPGWVPSWTVQPKPLKSMHEDWHSSKVCSRSLPCDLPLISGNSSGLSSWTLFGSQTTAW